MTYEEKNSAALKYAQMEINIMTGAFPGPLTEKVLRTPLNRISLGTLSSEKATGECSHCGSTAKDLRLHRYKGCRFCRNSKSDSFLEYA